MREKIIGECRPHGNRLEEGGTSSSPFKPVRKKAGVRLKKGAVKFKKFQGARAGRTVHSCSRRKRTPELSQGEEEGYTARFSIKTPILGHRGRWL